MTTGSRVAYNYAILRVVPHVPTGTFVNVGVRIAAGKRPARTHVLGRKRRQEERENEARASH